MSPMIAKLSAIRPPAPRPCTARAPISMPMFCAMPESSEPTMKTTIANVNSGLRP